MMEPALYRNCGKTYDEHVKSSLHLNWVVPNPFNVGSATVFYILPV